MSKTLILVGCGKMGGALLAGWLDAGRIDRCLIIEKDEAVAARFRDWSEVTILTDPDQIPDPAMQDEDPDAFVADLVLFAVKPQDMRAVVPHYRRLVRPQTVFLSIAAGKTIAALTGLLGQNAAIIRAMPNTPASVRAGFTVCVENPHVTPEEHEFAEYLLSYVGRVAWIEDEALLDAVTAVSGSGPAYVYLLMESLAEAGKQAGLPADLAERLARHTIIGAGLLAREESHTPPATLRANVTSKGGTTAAALDVLMAEKGLQDLITRAVLAAKQRSRELAQ